MLSDPALREGLEWSSEDLKGHTVANRLKALLSEEGKGSFQRVTREHMLDPASGWAQVCNIIRCSNHGLTEPHAEIIPYLRG